MRTKTIAAVFILAAGLAACKKRAPENIPQPKAADAAGTTTVSAGAAKALFERTAGQKMESLDLDGPGGN